LAIFGCLYAVLAAASVRALRPDRSRLANASAPRVSVLKPLHGAEPGLVENLASFIEQSYAGRIEILFGVQDPHDPAIDIVRELIRRYPDATLKLVVNDTRHGANLKVCNLANLAAAATGEILVLADSDMRVGPHYVARLTSALQQPGVGLVTCLYRGLPLGGPWARLSAMAIEQHFLPSVLVGLRLGLAHPCFGATIALRAETLAKVGGFAAFGNCLADDHQLGAAVRRLGLAVSISPMILEHVCSERTFSELVRHELRWARTHRYIAPAFVGTLLTYPLPLALLALMLDPGVACTAILLAAVVCRSVVEFQVAQTLGSRAVPVVRTGLYAVAAVPQMLGSRAAPIFWGAAREVLSFVILLASLLPGPIIWRGRRYRVVRGVLQ
jgi:ceramide glucosyltransferase